MLALLALSLFASSPAIAECAPPTEAAFPAELDAYVEDLLKEWSVPGAALAVVKDGKIVVAKGYGVRELGKPERVDADTVFDTASLTKSFTAAMIATLVDEGKLSWDAPARDYLPRIKPKDPYIAANVTLRDLLSHRVGTRNNAAPFRGHLTREQVVDVFSKLEGEPFRTSWVYSNVGYTVAGEVAAAVTGKSWEELVKSRLLRPLRMTRSTADYEAANAMRNRAVGHVYIDGVQLAAHGGSERVTTAAAGAVHASARDLAAWLLFQLGDGSANGKQLISADAMEEMHGPQVFVPSRKAFRDSRQLKRFAAYGLGWQVWDYRGRPFLWHTGNGDGQLAYMALYPEDELGVAIIVNTWRVSSQFNSAVIQRIADHYLGLAPRDYPAELRTSLQKIEAADAEEEKKFLAAKPEGAAPALALTEYVGQYRDKLGLPVDIALDGETLTFRYAGGQIARLEFWRDHLFRLKWTNIFSQWGADFVDFDVDALGEVTGLRMTLMRDPIEATLVEEGT
jgi:CubicO group peptidase (beta-lactamase class C family)